MSEQYIGSETLPPDGFMQPRRYKITARCLRCQKNYSWVTTKPGGPDRPCPKKKCREEVIQERVLREAENVAKMLEEQRAPGHIGANTGVKAIDETARIVMEDHKLTDLKDNIRPGEAMAPKLPGPQQAAADNFFTKNPLAERGVNARQAELLKRRAIGGAFRGMAVSPTVTGGTPGESPMRLVRTEKF